MSAAGVRVPRARVVAGRTLRGMRANPTLGAGVVILAVVVVVAVLAPILAPDPADAGNATHPLSVLLAPSGSHPFGTDEVAAICSRGSCTGAVPRCRS